MNRGIKPWIDRSIKKPELETTIDPIFKMKKGQKLSKLISKPGAYYVEV